MKSDVLIDTKPYKLADGGALDVDACPPCWERSAHTERYEWACEVFSGMRVIDYGCGVGYGTAMLAAAGNQVIGFDSSAAALFIARQRYPQCEFFSAGMFPVYNVEQWGGAVALEVLEHLADPEAWIRSINTRHVLVSVPVLVRGTEHHVHEFTTESLIELVTTRFDVRSIRVQRLPGHTRPAVVMVHGVLR